MSTPQISTSSILKTRLLGLAATLGLIGYVIGVPLLLVAIDAIPRPADVAWSRLTAPDDGTVALALIALMAWIAWAIFTVSVVVSIASRLRGLRAPRLPGLALPQRAADQIVGAAALLFVVLPTLAAVAPGPRPAAAATATAPVLDRVTTTASPTPAIPTPAARTVTGHPAAEHHGLFQPRTQPTEAYTVKRGDSLWKIAETRLGDGSRYRELVDLNRVVLDGEPDFLLPGTVLRVPVMSEPAASNSSGDPYVVEPGDTLSEIADHELGDAKDYPRIFDASRDRVQPDGKRLSDPDLIRPGWTLTVPGTGPQGAPRSPRPRPADSTPVTPSIPRAPTPTTRPTPAPQTANPESEVPDTAAQAADEAAPGWLLPGLAGAGALLAGSIYLVSRQQRRAQQRYRRPGRTIPSTPSELRPVAKSAHLVGSVTAPRITELDRALRDLASQVAPSPRLLTAALTSDQIELTLTEPADLPAPWFGAATSWVRPLTGEPDHASQHSSQDHSTAAPYPLLVSVGSTTEGAWLLINLEELRSITLTGDQSKALALGRHLAAELAVNPWSTLVQVHTLGLDKELAEIDPLRHHHHDGGDLGLLDRLGSDLEAENASIEPDQFVAVIADGKSADAEAIHNLTKIITSYAGRPAACVVTADAEPSTIDTAVRLDHDGRLTIPDLGITATAAGLTTTEADACATLVNLTRELDDSPIPHDNDKNAASDQAGALASRLTEPRPEEPDVPAGGSSLLPQANAAYVDKAATVHEDLDVLAPLVAPTRPGAVALTEPELDADLDAWHSPNLIRPRLTLLGAVSARTRGDAHKIAHRRPFYVELLTYLHLHPHGVTAEEISHVFGGQPPRARNDVSALRDWLGEDPRTHQLYLPKARRSYEASTPARYVVHGVLCDVDLFRRLRTRGQHRGEAGIADLVRALELVGGAPFSSQRETGWSWLIDADGIDHVMTAAIADVAHIVTTHALASGDIDLASFAVEKGATAAPLDEVIRLDLIAVGHALGYHDQAEQDLVEEVLNRRDDELGPLDTPPRTAQIIRQRGWAPPSRRAN